MIGAVSDAQLFEDLFRVVLSWELPELFVVSWCTVTSISYIHTCIQNKAIHVCVCVVSVFFFFLAWQSEKKKEWIFCYLASFFGFIPHWKVFAIQLLWVECRHVGIVSPNWTHGRTPRVSSKHGQQHIPSCFVYFISFCFVFFKKKKKCLRYLDARPGTKWHSRYENKTKNVPVLLMSFHSDNAAAMPVINRRIESRLDLSLQYIRNETEGGGECVGWSNTWNRLHWDDWDLFLVLLFFRRINEKGGIVNEGLGFQCVLVSKKRGRSRRNTHFLIAVVVTDCYGWNLMTDEV